MGTRQANIGKRERRNQTFVTKLTYWPNLNRIIIQLKFVYSIEELRRIYPNLK